jgi:hypothetical protein
MPTSLEIKVADETFIAIALLHRENPHQADFTVTEIVARAQKEHLTEVLRPGVRVHATLHCVANRPPNPGRYRMLYATGRDRRRLLQSGDSVHPDRKDGKTWPNLNEVPSKYDELIEWAKRRYWKEDGAAPSTWLDGILQLRGMGRELWKDEDADEYVRKLRENWG